VTRLQLEALAASAGKLSYRSFYPAVIQALGRRGYVTYVKASRFYAGRVEITPKGLAVLSVEAIAGNVKLSPAARARLAHQSDLHPGQP
jgi:hypothetical protein